MQSIVNELLLGTFALRDVRMHAHRTDHLTVGIKHRNSADQRPDQLALRRSQLQLVVFRETLAVALISLFNNFSSFFGEQQGGSILSEQFFFPVTGHLAKS